jgi:hypothetical protein
LAGLKEDNFFQEQEIIFTTNSFKNSASAALPEMAVLIPIFFKLY